MATTTTSLGLAVRGTWTRKTIRLVGSLLAVSLIGCSNEEAPGEGVGGSGSGGLSSAGGGGTACLFESDPSSACRDERQQECEKESLAACDENPNCEVLTARKVQAEALCVAPESEEVGCGALGCGALYTTAKDPEGTLWMFPSTCVPSTFTVESHSLVDDCGAGGEGGGRGN